MRASFISAKIHSTHPMSQICLLQQIPQLSISFMIKRAFHHDVGKWTPFLDLRTYSLLQLLIFLL
uniref:Uncharacterized protein MANES_07G058100 n=1 Tax=Rhizophora mucronata TaxID=61149 RepID=A0A2P2MFM4_RHIMU